MTDTPSLPAVTLVALLTLGGCRESSPLPDVGACADYPAGIYDYGDIGIGTCLSGPVDLKWRADPADPSQVTLLVTNANPYLDFTDGSVLAIDLSQVPLDGGEVVVSDVAASAISLPRFVGYMDLVPARDLLLVTGRYTEDARTRVGFDDLQFVDVSDPWALSAAPVGPGGATTLQLMSDPAPLVYDPTSGYAFVTNLTSHTVSVVDALADPIDVVDAVPGSFVSAGRFFDADGSGSRVEIASLEVYDSTAVIDQDWTVAFAEGSYRLWLPEPGGVIRVQSQGASLWRDSGLGYDFTAADIDAAITGIADPQPFFAEGTQYMTWADASGDGIFLSEEGAFAGNWVHLAQIVAPRSGAWDAAIGGPMPVRDGGLTWLFYDGVNAQGRGGIGLAVGEADSYRRVSDLPVLTQANGAHDSVRAADPYVLFDTQADVWRMYYSAYDGDTWTIGHAESPDLVEWTADPEPVFSVDAQDVAAPVVVYGNGGFRMWTARGDGTGWTVGLATSVDGTRWVDEGDELDLDVTDVEPPGVGLFAQVSRTWGVRGDTLGPTGDETLAGNVEIIADRGVFFELSAGALLTPDTAPALAANGVQVDSFLSEAGLVYATVIDADGVPRVGLADWNDGAPVLREDALLEGQSGSFDANGVSHAVVFPVDGGYRMLYAGTDGDTTSIGAAESSDGVVWTTDHTVAFARGDSWDSIRMLPGSVVVEDDGSYTLWYTGSDSNTRSRVGRATSADGVSWTRVPGADDPWDFAPGAPGTFDDSAVRHPWVLSVDGTEHLWYAGFDGESWNIGYASRPVGESEWTRATAPWSGEVRAVLTGYDGNFDADQAYRPVVWKDDDGVFQALYTGQDGAVPRVGRASGLSPDRLYRAPLVPTAGDVVEFTTWLGDYDQETAISLKRQLEGYETNGEAISLMHLDEARGVVYVASKTANFIYVLDIRDDSTDSWRDANYLNIEAVLVANTDVGAIGFRGMIAPAGSDRLYALNDSPESIMAFDLTLLEDDDRTDVLPAAVVGWLPTSRAGALNAGRDAGATNSVALGPAQVVLRDNLLFVTNFNDNTIGVYDLRLGAYGALIHEIGPLGENPYSMAISPDGTLLAVADYVGELDGLRVSSSLSIVDIDPESPTWLEVVARIVNQ
ncbi:MAG: hypothetical protein H6739_23945 [Alphaproteobacteria bacterium]|nr:hypothetical protein [Alphaproteobacteria bacterium]